MSPRLETQSYDPDQWVNDMLDNYPEKIDWRRKAIHHYIGKHSDITPFASWFRYDLPRQSGATTFLRKTFAGLHQEGLSVSLIYPRSYSELHELRPEGFYTSGQIEGFRGKRSDYVLLDNFQYFVNQSEWKKVLINSRVLEINTVDYRSSFNVCRD